MRMRLILLQKSLITKFITLKVCKSDDFLDTWWDYIFKSDNYLFFSKAAKAVLYSFIGWQIGIFTSCMDIGAIMKVNYDLISKDHSYFREYHCKNILHDPINTVLILSYEYCKLSTHKNAAGQFCEKVYMDIIFQKCSRLSFGYYNQKL